MNRVYSFAIKLQDMFTPTMLKISQTYERRVGVMERIWSKFRSSISSATKPLESLRRGLLGLKGSVKLKINTSELDSANSKLGRFRDALGRIRESNGRFAAGGGSRFGGLGGGFLSSFVGGIGGGLAYGGAQGIMDGIGGLFRNSGGAALTHSANRWTMGQLMGTQQTAMLEKQIQGYAPHLLAELMKSGMQLNASGIASDSVFGELKKLTNLAALSNSNVGELAYIQSKIRATGYLQGDEMDMYRERGINLNPYIAQVMGVNESAIKKLQEKGLITYDVFSRALEKFVGVGSKHENVFADRMQQTEKGKWEMVSGRMSNKLREFGENKLLPIFSKFVGFISDLMEKSGPLERSLGRVWNGFMRIGKGVSAVMIGFGLFNSNVSAAQNIINTLTWTSDKLAWVLDKIGVVLELLSKTNIPELVVGLWGVNKLIGILGSSWLAFNSVVLASPIGAAAASFLALAAAIGVAYEKWEGFRHLSISTWEGLKVFFSSIGMAMDMLARRDWAGLISLNHFADKAAQNNAAMAIYRNDRSRMGDKVLAGVPGRASLIGSGSASDGTGALPGALPPGGGLGAAAGLNATVGNAKSQSITINLASLINHSEINVMNWDEGEINLEQRLIDALARIAQSAGKMAY